MFYTGFNSQAPLISVSGNNMDKLQEFTRIVLNHFNTTKLYTVESRHLNSLELTNSSKPIEIFSEY